MSTKIKKTLYLLADTRIFFYCCVWLIVLLVLGTLAQRNMGLHQAQENYFSSWAMMLGPVPLPGGRLTLLVIFLNLLFYFFFKATWNKRKIGLAITHLGALCLLFGGFLTAYFSSEGSMLIPEGQTVGFYQENHSLELALTNQNPDNYNEVTSFSQGWLQEGRLLEAANFPGTLEVMAFYPHCKPVALSQVEPDFRGLARNYQLERLPLQKEWQENRAGMMLRLTGADAKDGVYLLLQDAKNPQKLNFSGASFELNLRQKHIPLPFAIELLDFEKQVHPGTQKASSFKSKVNVVQDDNKRRVDISMNKPLRQNGYTFYQSSYTQDGRATVLSVVKNYGRRFPYIASIIMCFGLLIHLFIKLPGLATNARRMDA